LRVERSVWRIKGLKGGDGKEIINPPRGKAAGAAPIPLVKILQDALEAHRKRMGVLAAPDLPIFQSGETTPLSLSNLARRIIIPKIEKCVKCRNSKADHPTAGHLFELDQTLRWHGWHAFRRGLATNLHALGIQDRDIQGILRHSNILVTQGSYVKSLAVVQADTLDLLAEKMNEGALCTDHGPKPHGAIN
jgi:hypothetical protein